MLLTLCDNIICFRRTETKVFQKNIKQYLLYSPAPGPGHYGVVITKLTNLIKYIVLIVQELWVLNLKKFLSCSVILAIAFYSFSFFAASNPRLYG